VTAVHNNKKSGRETKENIAMEGSSPPYFVVIRHSERLDMREEGTRSAAGKNGEAFTTSRQEASDVLGDHDDVIVWSDRNERPWDPPMSDYELPARVIEHASLQSLNISVIYSSPFRRCLETAAVAAVSLGLQQGATIHVHPGLGEIMTKVRQGYDGTSNTNGENASDSIKDNSNSKDYLLSKDQCAKIIEKASGGKAQMDQCSFMASSSNSSIPPWNETYAESMNRLEMTLCQLQEKHAASSTTCKVDSQTQQHTNNNNHGSSVLVVTHGDALQAAAQAFLGQTTSVYDLDFCALMVFDADLELISRHGLRLLEF
jgi:broad specificity phosphatase PhoE